MRCVGKMLFNMAAVIENETIPCNANYKYKYAISRGQPTHDNACLVYAYYQHIMNNWIYAKIKISQKENWHQFIYEIKIMIFSLAAITLLK